ncbi:MAG: DNA polymerase III subunit delta [Micrococcaceae bacterium]
MQHIYLILGSEDYLVFEAKKDIKDHILAADPATEIIELSAADYSAGSLHNAASPSLFSSNKLLFVDQLEKMNEEFISDTQDFIKDIPEDVVTVFHHAGGQKGKKILDLLKKKAEVIEAKPLTKEMDKVQFVRKIFKKNERTIEPQALRLLLSSVGSQLSELGNAAQQLIDDTNGEVTDEMVEQYYGGRVEVTVFKVVDAATAGNTEKALAGLRHAMSIGLEAVPLVAAMAAKLRTMARVSDKQGNPASLAKELGAAPWQLQQAQRDLRGWNPKTLTQAIEAVADADSEVKGGSKDPNFAVENMVRIVSSAAKGN